jgi:hypothetical protein
MYVVGVDVGGTNTGKYLLLLICFTPVLVVFD